MMMLNGSEKDNKKIIFSRENGTYFSSWTLPKKKGVYVVVPKIGNLLLKSHGICMFVFIIVLTWHLLSALWARGWSCAFSQNTRCVVAPC